MLRVFLSSSLSPDIIGKSRQCDAAFRIGPMSP
jgi:hypothetical protein